MKTNDVQRELRYHAFSERAVLIRRSLTACLMVAGLMASVMPAWTQPPPIGPVLPTGPSIPPVGPGIPPTRPSIPPIVPSIPSKPPIPLTQPWEPHFVPRIVATPQAGGPCGLHTATDPNFVQIKLEAKANGPFKVTLSWSGPAGLYHLNEEGGPFHKDVDVTPNPFGAAASEVQEPALPGSKHSYVVKAQLPDGRTACGTASVTTPSPPPITSVSGRYVDDRNVTINYHIPAFVTALRILRQPREVVERPNPANPDMLLTEFKSPPADTDGSWSGNPGPPPFPYTKGQYDKSVASYPFILEAVWTKWPDGSGERVSVRTPISISGPTAIVGYSDLHAHMFSYLGFGGRFWGKAFGSIDKALAWCTPQHGPGGTGDLADYIMQIATVGHVPPNTGHAVGGNPKFDGWPRWNSFTHQSYYEDWLKRAHDKGLQLIVTHPVNNEWMCTTLNHVSTAELSLALATGVSFIYTIPSIAYWQTHVDPSCLDKDAAENQIKEAFAMQDDIDMRVGDGLGNKGPGTGWFRIVTTPKEARDVIAAGKLAVVIGMEVDYPFECTVNNTSCTESFMRSQVDRYYNLGVRHFFPIHFYDNAFGGSANSNALVTRQLKNTGALRDCSASGFQYENAQCNDKGLTLLGRQLIDELMKHGMIIDIDHMSEKAFNDTMTLVSDTRYPVVSSHSGFTELAHGDENNEGNRTPIQILDMINLGGMFAVIPHQESKLGQMTQVASSGGASIDYTCGNSSQAVAQAYRYAITHTRGGPVGLGTDLNGFAGWPSPRFGSEACSGGGNSAGEPMLTYPATIKATAVSIPVDKSVVGTRTYDFNFDGFAHIGMLPDMIADFEAMGMQPPELDALFFSAEGYIRLWERAHYMRTQTSP
jgi:microsomal dipeptidase-like Zn-dependent dipeptidase